MNMVILWRLLFAHFLADFILQTDWICHEKKQRNAKGMGVLGIHCLIHAAVAYLLVGQWDNWMIPTVIFVSHYAMDWYKVHRMDLGLTPFLIDQSVHILVILALWTVGYADLDSLVKTVDTWNTPSTWVVGLTYMLALKPAGLLVGIFISKWTPKETKELALPNAGTWIGYLERVIILTFVLVGHPEGVGFLLAAKSIFRFGDLSRAQEIRTTEYVLVGTLSSFCVAILLGFAASSITG